jgi:hypothetical protein
VTEESVVASIDAAPRARTAAHRHAAPRPGLRRPDAVDRVAALERRRRERHFRARRRDVLVDTGVALVLSLALLTLTAGLGVVALIVVPLAAALVASNVLMRLLSRRRATVARAPRRR